MLLVRGDCARATAEKPVVGASAYTTDRDRFNTLTVDALETTGLRIEVQLREDVSRGILKWRVHE